MCFHTALFGQQEAPSSEMDIMRLELEKLSDSLSQSTDWNARKALNEKFTQLFGKALEAGKGTIPGIQSIQTISVLHSSNGQFSAYTWELEGPSMFGYYGYIVSRKPDQKAIVFKLNDRSEEYGRAEYHTGRADDWYGALYYDMKEVEYKKETYYLMLGINRSKLLTKERLMEVAFVEAELQFGKEVFNTGDRVMKKRLVFPHSNDSEMTLFFESDELVVMDHLAPLSPGYEGKFQYYVPDLSYDALKKKKGIWKFQEDYDARLQENLKDRYFEMELKEEKNVY